MSTKIQWCDETWNPVTGCTPISEGCANCYAKKMFGRNLWGYDFTPQIHEKRFVNSAELKGHGKRIFVCSMGDLFHPDILPWMRYKVFKKCYDLRNKHTYIFLTKRPDIMLEFVTNKDHSGYCSGEMFFENGKLHPSFWLGVTAENQARADERIPILLQIPASVRFVSVEPMLEPISLRWQPYAHQATGETYRQYLNRKRRVDQYEALSMLDWVIAGPETGTGARRCNPQWIESLWVDCCDAGVPFFDKRDDYLDREFPEAKEPA